MRKGVPYLLECKMTVISYEPPQIKYVFQGKMYLSKSKTTSKNYTSSKKNILLLLDTLNVQSMPDCICIYQSLSLSPSSQSVPSLFSHSLLTFPSSLMPFHNVSSAFPSTALDIQHFFNPFAVISGEMHCHTVVIYTN